MQRIIPYIFTVSKEGKDEAAEKLAAAICTPESESAEVVHDFTKSANLKDLLKKPSTLVFYGQGAVGNRFGGYSAWDFAHRVKENLSGRERDAIDLWLIGTETGSSVIPSFAQAVANVMQSTAFANSLRVFAIAKPKMKSDQVFCVEVITHSSLEEEGTEGHLHAYVLSRALVTELDELKKDRTQHEGRIREIMQKAVFTVRDDLPEFEFKKQQSLFVPNETPHKKNERIAQGGGSYNHDEQTHQKSVKLMRKRQVFLQTKSPDDASNFGVAASKLEEFCVQLERTTSNDQWQQVFNRKLEEFAAVGASVTYEFLQKINNGNLPGANLGEAKYLVEIEESFDAASPRVRRPTAIARARADSYGATPMPTVSKPAPAPQTHIEQDKEFKIKPVKLFSKEAAHTEEDMDEVPPEPHSESLTPPPLAAAKPPSSDAPNISPPADTAATPPNEYADLLAQYKTEMRALRGRVQTTINQRQASMYFPMTLFSDSITEALTAQLQALDNLLKVDNINKLYNDAINPDIVPAIALGVTSDVTRWLERVHPGSTRERKQSPVQNCGCSS